MAAAAEEDEEAEAEAGDEGGGHGVPAAKGEEKSRAQPAAGEGLDGTRRARLSSGDACLLLCLLLLRRCRRRKPLCHSFFSCCWIPAAPLGARSGWRLCSSLLLPCRRARYTQLRAHRLAGLAGLAGLKTSILSQALQASVQLSRTHA